MPSFIDKLSTNDNDYRIEPYRLIDNQPEHIAGLREEKALAD
jgi:hypothetical protein